MSEREGNAKERAAEAKNAEAQLKSVLRSALEEPAYERLMNVAIANKELYTNTAKQLLMAYQRIGRKIKEEEVIMVLKKINEPVETRITFHKK
ncbi:hypothetical protein HY988_06430 [Candidatus Micrarchaeota archaeon]|nr:hypothetical protein [Candidatus Micrarchaeota archaeon]